MLFFDAEPVMVRIYLDRNCLLLKSFNRNVQVLSNIFFESSSRKCIKIPAAPI